MSKATAFVILGLALLVAVILTSINSNESTSTACDSGRMKIYEDGSAVCITKIKGAYDDN